MLSERYEMDPKMWSPWSALGISLFYLYFVLWAGPKAMANRKPFSLKPFLILYNAFIVSYCSAWLYKIFSTEGLVKYLYNNVYYCSRDQEDKYLESVVTDLNRYYFYSKIIDLLDTVFFVLRKKDNQVSFLHVYHHTVMVLMTWHNIAFGEARINIFVMAVNTMVHVVMYFYYFLAALGPSARKFLFWKKYVTILQLSSFAVIMSYLLSFVAMGYEFTNRVILTSVLFNLSIIALFLNFFRQSYSSKKRIKTQ